MRQSAPREKNLRIKWREMMPFKICPHRHRSKHPKRRDGKGCNGDAFDITFSCIWRDTHAHTCAPAHTRQSKIAEWEKRAFHRSHAWQYEWHQRQPTARMQASQVTGMCLRLADFEILQSSVCAPSLGAFSFVHFWFLFFIYIRLVDSSPVFGCCGCCCFPRELRSFCAP